MAFLSTVKRTTSFRRRAAVSQAVASGALYILMLTGSVAASAPLTPNPDSSTHSSLEATPMIRSLGRGVSARPPLRRPQSWKPNYSHRAEADTADSGTHRAPASLSDSPRRPTLGPETLPQENGVEAEGAGFALAIQYLEARVHEHRVARIILAAHRSEY